MTIKYRISSSLVDCYRALSLTRGIDQYYPDFEEWYWNKVVPNVSLGESALILAEYQDELVGVSMVKSGDEPKIRCLRVHQTYAGRGIGIHLIDQSLQYLDHDSPAVTVPEEKIHDLSRILVNRFDFNLSYVDRGVYRPGKLEYQFNTQANMRLKTAY